MAAGAALGESLIKRGSRKGCSALGISVEGVLWLLAGVSYKLFYFEALLRFRPLYKLKRHRNTCSSDER